MVLTTRQRQQQRPPSPGSVLLGNVLRCAFFCEMEGAVRGLCVIGARSKITCLLLGKSSFACLVAAISGSSSRHSNHTHTDAHQSSYPPIQTGSQSMRRMPRSRRWRRKANAAGCTAATSVLLILLLAAASLLPTTATNTTSTAPVDLKAKEDGEAGHEETR